MDPRRELFDSLTSDLVSLANANLDDICPCPGPCIRGKLKFGTELCPQCSVVTNAKMRWLSTVLLGKRANPVSTDEVSKAPKIVPAPAPVPPSAVPVPPPAQAPAPPSASAVKSPPAPVLRPPSIAPPSVPAVKAPTCSSKFCRFVDQCMYYPRPVVASQVSVNPNLNNFAMEDVIAGYTSDGDLVIGVDSQATGIGFSDVCDRDGVRIVVKVFYRKDGGRARWNEFSIFMDRVPLCNSAYKIFHIQGRCAFIVKAV